MVKKTKKAWPTKKAMAQVYEMNLWGNNSTEFYSGSGSHDPYIVEPYIDTLEKFLSSFDQPLTICDLGCGDFNIGKQLIGFTKSYIGIDIVPKLIEYNTKIYKHVNLEFKCLDIAVDDLPKSDCVIIRQVLQHLSNSEILNVIEKLQQYKYIVLTEHLPCGEFEPNKNIISGQGIRIKKKSGVDLLSSPFNLNIAKEQHIQTITLPESKGIIKTVVYYL